MNGIATRNSSSWLLKKPQICGRLIIASPRRILRFVSLESFTEKLPLSPSHPSILFFFITASDAFQLRLAIAPDRLIGRPYALLAILPQAIGRLFTVLS